MTGEQHAARTRAAAAGAIDEVLSRGRSLDAALADAERGLPMADHALLRMLCYGCLRHRWQLEAWANSLLDRPLRKRDSVVAALLAVGLYQLAATRVPDHAAVSTTVEAVRLLRRPGHARLVNAVLRRFMRESLAERPGKGETERFNHPQWMIDTMRGDWPSDWQAVLEANNAQAPMWLRVNRQRCSLEAYRQRLDRHGIEATGLVGFDQALRLDAALPVADLPGFAVGDVSVQDAAAQIAAAWLIARTKGRILDACAAPGGKSAHLKELGGEQIDLTCVDIDAARLESLRANLDRVGAAATVCHGDASKPDEWWNNQPFDGILLDAPCSASGVIRRHPDIKSLRRAGDIDALARRQAALLRALWGLLAPGGCLLYATCSVFSAENDAVVRGFLDTAADARESNTLQNNNMRDVMRRKACGYQVLPGTVGLDGFYYACLQKVA